MQKSSASSTIVHTDIPFRLDRLPWSRFHLLVVIGLGITWILDGLGGARTTRCRVDLFRPLRMRHIIGVGVAAAGEITSRNSPKPHAVTTRRSISSSIGIGFRIDRRPALFDTTDWLHQRDS